MTGAQSVIICYLFLQKHEAMLPVLLFGPLLFFESDGELCIISEI